MASNDFDAAVDRIAEYFKTGKKLMGALEHLEVKPKVPDTPAPVGGERVIPTGWEIAQALFYVAKPDAKPFAWDALPDHSKNKWRRVASVAVAILVEHQSPYDYIKGAKHHGL